MARCGQVRHGEAGEAGLGSVRYGTVRWCGVWFGEAGQEWQGVDRWGRLWFGRRVKAGQDEIRCGMAGKLRSVSVGLLGKGEIQWD
jgi:hypothetical protein